MSIWWQIWASAAAFKQVIFMLIGMGTISPFSSTAMASHDAAYIEKIIEPIIAGRADYVVGSRFVGHESDFKSSFARRCGIHVLSFAVKVRTGVRVYDVTSRFRAVNRDVIKRLAACYPVDYPEPESLAMVLRSGLSVEEVGVAMHERSGGESSISGFSSILYMAKVGLAILFAEEMG